MPQPREAARRGRKRPAAEKTLRLDVDLVLLDIEGTISPVSFVRDVLFAYSRQKLAGFLAEHRDDPAVAAILEEASVLAGGKEAGAALAAWQERDEKAPPLKKIQGLIWDDGYRSGAFRSPVYPDALAAMRDWHARGIPLYIYSSGSKHAQLLFFEFNREGDLRSLFSGHYDTGIGAKSDPQSYARIAHGIGAKPERIAFFSDNGSELEAARETGLEVVHVVKDETRPDARFPEIRDYGEVTIAGARKPARKPQTRRASQSASGAGRTRRPAAAT